MKRISIALLSATLVTSAVLAAPTHAATKPQTFVMPKVVGMVLQDAQDLLQTKGSFLMDQQDASGRGRMQILDRNWRVCRQNPAPGKKVPITTVVVLASVKLSERCP